MKQIRTTCEGCAFKVHSGCYLNKPVYLEEKSQFVLGFCGTKRQKDWIPKHNNLSLIDNLECDEKISVSILCLDNNTFELKKTLECLPFNYLERVVVVLQNPAEDQEKEAIELMSGLVKTSWSVDKVLDTDELDLLMMADYSTRLIKSSWVLILKAGDIVDNNSLITVDLLISDIMDNSICFYFDENNSLKLLFNLKAFEQLQGNYESSFFDKLKTFDNWRDFCKKID